MAKRRPRQPAPCSPAQPQRPPRADVPLWRCPNCGQRYFGDHPPDLCDYCQDFTTWERVDERDTPA